MTTRYDGSMLARNLASLFACALAVPACSLLFSPGDEVASLEVDAAGPKDAAADADPSLEWFDPNAQERLEFVIENQSGEELVEFPVLVRLESSTLDIAHLDNGFVIVHDGALVNYEIDTAPAERLTRKNLWLRATLPPSSSHSYHLYYDFQTPPDSTPTDEIFSAYLAVWHMQAQGMTVPNATGSPSLSATLNTGISTEEGLIGAAITSASGSALTTNSAVDAPGSCLSLSAWVQPAAQDNVLRSLYDSKSLANNSGNNSGVLMSYQTQSAGPLAVIASVGDSPAVDYVVPTDSFSPAQLTVGQWHHLALRIDGLKAQLLINGNDALDEITAEAANGFDFAGAALILGGDLSGAMDEVRVSTRCLSSKWMRAEYLNVIESFVIFGAPETRP